MPWGLTQQSYITSIILLCATFHVQTRRVFFFVMEYTQGAVM